ncbi:putative transcriptional regulator with CopG/Arc/MetJ DNA-binding domain and metal-binding domain [Thioflavicoccus mobilis 8321]|uniref:Putative nickel-responsive regulator n=1 Tax=Thioflavicoccus mobilis 8321 TaxID=765912 RepID=L0H1L8_9GAMM|nr:nickel-responsive transcriptional regulator NikR [Thioflavicoccus mobilis]AGA91520.1 putative transcriptional regulator with CopG/Arc/MetJ DNA-binding domain and metal-binding domain [Thioflavicoccus mobilis 8321]
MPKTEDTIRFSVSLPRPLLDELDRRVVGRGYASRSELVRDLIRERLVEDAWTGGDEEVAGVLTIVYDHHQRDLTQQIVDVQHRDFVHVIATTHVHVDHHNCLEVIILRGRPAEIERLSLEIGGLRGVRLAKLTQTARLEM